jgi:hypothetical protein
MGCENCAISSLIGRLLMRFTALEYSSTEEAMALTFPNDSRSYDATRRAVRFWGHDHAMEVSFFVSDEALKRLQPDLKHDELGLLQAFDVNRKRVQAAAVKAYGRGHKGSYELIPADF